MSLVEKGESEQRGKEKRERIFFLFSHVLFEEINNVLDATVKINSKNLIKMF